MPPEISGHSSRLSYSKVPAGSKDVNFLFYESRKGSQDDPLCVRCIVRKANGNGQIMLFQKNTSESEMLYYILRPRGIAAQV